MNDIRYELMNDENLVWEGKPTPSLFTSADIFLIPFSILWGGFAIFWEAMVIFMGAPFFFMLWGIPFVLVGLYMMFGRFFVRHSIMKNTRYYITDQRIIVKSGFRSITTRAEYISAIPVVNSKEKTDGSGDLIFGNMPFGMGMMQNSGMEFFGHQRRYGPMPVSFHNIPDIARVKRIIHDLRNNQYTAEY